MAQLDRKGWLGKELTADDFSGASDDDESQAISWFRVAAGGGNTVARTYLDAAAAAQRAHDITGLWSCSYIAGSEKSSISLNIQRDADGTYVGDETYRFGSRFTTTTGLDPIRWTN